MAEASLKLGGDWATKDGSLLGFNDQNGNYKPIPFDFTRATTATRVNRNGLIEEVQAGVPRIDFLDNPDGSLKLEPQRTNSITRSEDFNITWGKNDVTVSADATISPDGTQNADKLVETNTLAFHFVSFGTTINAEPTVFSFYAKAAERTSVSAFLSQSGNVGANFDLSAETATANGTGNTASIESVGNGWYRCIIINDGSADLNNSVRIGIQNGALNSYQGDGTSGIYIWGAQLEINESYPTSYIKTSGSAVTRNADACNNAETTFNDSEGVLYAEFKNEDTTNYRLISISDGTDNNRIFLGTRLTTGYIYYFVISGGSTQASYITTDLASDFTKVAVKYKANDFAFWINGIEVSTDSSGSTPTGLDVLQFNGGSGIWDFYGNCKEVRVYNTALTDTELQELTTI